MSVPKAIIITSVPKYIGTDGSLSNHVGVKLKPGNSILRCNSSTISGAEIVPGKIVIPKVEPVSAVKCEEPKMTSRKRRLDHLTLEEKLQRKKLKNRVAAQSSRDKKKARMDTLEHEVRTLKEKNEVLIQQCETLQLEKTQLATQNEVLRSKLLNYEQNHQAHDVCCRVQKEPAEFNLIPLPQGWTLQQALDLGFPVQHLVMWKVMTSILLSLISSTVLMEIFVYLTWMNWQKAYSEKLLKKWMLKKGNTTPRLDSLGAKEKEAILKWWGRHQKMWKPIEN